MAWSAQTQRTGDAAAPRGLDHRRARDLREHVGVVEDDAGRPPAARCAVERGSEPAQRAAGLVAVEPLVAVRDEASRASVLLPAPGRPMISTTSPLALGPAPAAVAGRAACATREALVERCAIVVVRER